MKKLFISILILLAFGLKANAENGINVGISLQAGVFEVDGASEKFSGAHTSGAATGNVTKKSSSEGENAEGLFAIGSLFVEKTIGDKFAIGVDYVPHSMDSETTDNTQTTTTASATGKNTVQVDFEDLTTVYGMFSLNDNVYAKVGYMMVDVITNENLATGGSYQDAELEGGFIGFGYERALPANSFIRIEGNYTQIDDVSVTNSADSTKKITISDIDGYGAKLSIGKSF